MDFPTLSIQLLNALQYGLLLFLVASGLTLIFGIMGIINIAHGSFYMLGAYIAWSLAGALNGFWLSLVVGVVLTLILGIALEWLFIRHLYDKNHLQQVLMTYGLILIFSEMRSILWGDDVYSLAIPEFLEGSIALTESLNYPIYRIWISGVCVFLAAEILRSLPLTKRHSYPRALEVLEHPEHATRQSSRKYLSTPRVVPRALPPL